MRIEAEVERFAMSRPFAVHGHVWTEMRVVRAVAAADGAVGQGEGTPLFYRPEETPEGLAAAIRAVAAAHPGGLDRAALATTMPAGGARNALDCTLWDLEAKRSGTPVWALAGLDAPRPLLTMCTVGLLAPEAAAETAARYAPDFPLLKIKLGGGDGRDLARMEAVRRAAPRARLVIDANAGWTIDELAALAPRLAEMGVELIEQPLPPERDADLDGYVSPVPLCADESCQTPDSVPDLAGRYQFMNIKLDKAGGLTTALAMARQGLALGIRPMVGNMLGTSLAMAPAFILGQLCTFCDLDGPMCLGNDRDPPTVYRDGHMMPPPRELWG